MAAATRCTVGHSKEHCAFTTALPFEGSLHCMLVLVDGCAGGHVGWDGRWEDEAISIMTRNEGMTCTEGYSLEEARSVDFMTCYMWVNAVLDGRRIGGSGTRTVTAATCCIETHLT